MVTGAPNIELKKLNKLLQEFLKWYSIFKSDVFENKELIEINS